MKSNIINIFILYVIFISYSCNGGGDCAYSTTCEGLYYGDYNVKDSTQYWLPNKIDSAFVINNIGERDLMLVEDFKSHDKVNFTSRSEKYNNGDCGIRTLSCSDHYYISNSGWKYSSSKFNLNISVYRRPLMSITNILTYKPDSTQVFSKGDMIITLIGNRSFIMNFQDEIFYNRIEINNNTVFDSVYEATNDYYYPNTIYPVKVYINKGKGLVGFVLNNNEVWKLDVK